MIKSIVVGLGSEAGYSADGLSERVREIETRSRKPNTLRFVGFEEAEGRINELVSKGENYIELYGLWSDGYVGYLTCCALNNGISVRIPRNMAPNSPDNPEYSLEEDIKKAFSSNGKDVQIKHNGNYTMFYPIRKRT